MASVGRSGWIAAAPVTDQQDLTSTTPPRGTRPPAARSEPTPDTGHHRPVTIGLVRGTDTGSPPETRVPRTKEAH